MVCLVPDVAADPPPRRLGGGAGPLRPRSARGAPPPSRSWRMCRRRSPTWPAVPLGGLTAAAAGRRSSRSGPVAPVAPAPRRAVGPVAPVAPVWGCAVPLLFGAATVLLPAGLQSWRSVEPSGQTDGSYGGEPMFWLIPGWFGAEPGDAGIRVGDAGRRAVARRVRHADVVVAGRRVVVRRVVARVVAARRGRRQVVDAEVQHVPVLVVLVDGARLVVDVVEEALHAGVARGGLAAGGPAGGLLVVAAARCALVDLDRALRRVDVEQELVERVGRRVGVLAGPRQGLDLVLALGERLAAGDRRLAEAGERAVRSRR